MVHWDAIPKWFQVLGSVVGLSATAGTVWNRVKQWLNPDNARQGNPELLAKYLELHEKIPRYVPAKEDLLATIQEMTLEFAEDPARVMRRRNARFQIYSMWLGGLFLLFGAALVAISVVTRTWGAVLPGTVVALLGLVLLLVVPIGMDRAMDRDAARVKVRRTAFKKDRSWPEKVDLPKPAKTRSTRSFLPGARRLRILRRARRLRNDRKTKALGTTAEGASNPEKTSRPTVLRHAGTASLWQRLRGSMNMFSRKSRGDFEPKWKAVTGRVQPLPLKWRISDWFATSLLGVKLVLVVAVPSALAWCFVEAIQFVAHLAAKGTVWSNETRVDPRPGSVVDHTVPYVIFAVLGVLAVWLVLALFRAIPRLVMVWVLLRTVEHKNPTSVARRRLQQFFVVPKGFGMVFVSSFLGALFGLSVTNVPEAQGLLHVIIFVLENLFLDLMMFVVLIMMSVIQDDLDKMSPASRMAAAEAFLKKWAERFPRTTLRNRLLRPSRRTRHLFWHFAEKPAVFSELFVPTLSVFGLVASFVWHLFSPLF